MSPSERKLVRVELSALSQETREWLLRQVGVDPADPRPYVRVYIDSRTMHELTNRILKPE